MKIRKVKKDGTKALVTCDDGSTFELELQVTGTFSTGAENSTDDEPEAFREKTEYYKVRDNAMRYLARRNHSVFEIRKKLFLKKYAEGIIEKVIEELKSIGYLDDRKFACDYLDYREKFKLDGLGKIEAQLLKKGVAKDIVQEVLDSRKNDQCYLLNASKLADKKIQSLKRLRSMSVEKIREKLNFYLQNKGYSFETINKVLIAKKNTLS